MTYLNSSYDLTLSAYVILARLSRAYDRMIYDGSDALNSLRTTRHVKSAFAGKLRQRLALLTDQYLVYYSVVTAFNCFSEPDYIAHDFVD